MSWVAIRETLRRRVPWLVPLVRRVRAAHMWVWAPYCARVLVHRLRHPRSSVFRSIYRRGLWGGGSGGGSGLEATRAVREQLPVLTEQLGVRSVLDAPCGDYVWMSEVRWDLDSYVGVDIVPEVIERNRVTYETEHVQFRVADITRDHMPRADLVLVRDCFVHMSHRDVTKALRTLRDSGSTYLLTTTYPGAVKRNWNIVSGWWRALDFQRPPFNFPAPERVIDEHNTEQYDKREKSLGLWRFADLPLGERS
jgi:hypothetical protein